MRVCFFFFLFYTIIEVLFVGFHYLLVQKVDMTIVLGTLLYAFCMMKSYKAYRHARYQKMKWELLQRLP